MPKKRLFAGSLVLAFALSALPAEALTATRQPGGDPVLMNMIARAAARRAARVREAARLRQNHPVSLGLVRTRRLAAVRPQPTVQRSTVTAPLSPVSTMTAVERQFADAVFELTNVERVKAGLRPLRRNATLDVAAQRHAEDMDDNNFFDHRNKQGEYAGDRIQQVGYAYLAYGENIAKGQEAPAKVVNDWMQSPGHKANLMLPEFDEIGIGVSDTSWVQNFAQSRTRFEAPRGAEEILLQLLNEDRARAGATALTLDERLDQTAAAVVANMRLKDAFVYEDASGHSLRSLLEDNGFISNQSSYSILQLAVSGSKTATEALVKFLETPDDTKDTRNPRYSSAGVAVSGLYWFLILADR
ncbi:MAG TPA: CAP domain-containing protein [Candidatus Peribacteraceae bacterium]|nr:CAP domain-containing protein [Candidatus Peribacteraceae bacterium]